MAQGINPTAGTAPHPNQMAPPGTTTMTVASCAPAGGAPYFGSPFLVYPIPHPFISGNGGAAVEGKGRVKQVPPAVAAVDLAWWPTTPAPRLASDQEVTDFVLASADRTKPAGRNLVTI